MYNLESRGFANDLNDIKSNFCIQTVLPHKMMGRQHQPAYFWPGYAISERLVKAPGSGLHLYHCKNLALSCQYVNLGPSVSVISR